MIGALMRTQRNSALKILLFNVGGRFPADYLSLQSKHDIVIYE
jgi:hypothetical protein